MVLSQSVELPRDGLITREVFDALPTPSGRWVWQLRAGSLELMHLPVTGWQWLTVVAALDHWHRLGHATAGDQYVADGGFMSGDAGGTSLVVGGVAFTRGHSPEDADAGMHDAANVHAVIDALPADGGERTERDAVWKLAAYARMGVPCYWIIRPQIGSDGLISVYELGEGEYRLVGHRLLSQLEA